MKLVPTTPIEVKAFLLGGPQPHEMVFINVIRGSVSHQNKDKLIFRQENGVKITVCGFPWMIEDLTDAPEIFELKCKNIMEENKREREFLHQRAIGSDDPNLDDEDMAAKEEIEHADDSILGEILEPKHATSEIDSEAPKTDLPNPKLV